MQPDSKPPSEDEEEPEPQRWGKRETELMVYCYETLCSWPLFLHLVMVLSLVWLTGFMQYNYPLVVFAAMFYLHKVDNVQKERLRIQIQNKMDEERSRLLLSTDAETVVWLNAILQECWPSWLERYLSHLIMNCLHLNLPYYKPKALSKLVIDHLRLGSSPPVIQFAKVHRNPTAARGEQAVLELDLTFVAAEDMKLELIARLKKASMGLGLAGKLYGNNLRVEGKLRLGLKFVPFYPYLGQLTVAFASVPVLGLSVRPLSSSSVDVTDLPGIASWVSRAIQAAVETFLVEPHPLVVDLIKLCGADYRFDVDKDETAGMCGNIKEPKDAGFVILEVLECKDLECKDRTGFVDPYVKICLDKVKFKTSIKKQTVNPIWHELFRLRISSWGLPCRLLLRVRDRDVFGKDDELGCCFLDVAQLQGAKRHDMWLQLHGVKTGQIHIAATVVDINSGISVDYYEDIFSGSSSSENTTVVTATAMVCPCVCKRDHNQHHIGSSSSNNNNNNNNGVILVDDSIPMRAKMKQVNKTTSPSPSCLEHPHQHHCSMVDDSLSTTATLMSYHRPKIKHVRVASVDSDRFEGVFDSKGNPILESREGLTFSNCGTPLISTVAVDGRVPSMTLPSVAEQRREPTDFAAPGGKARNKRRTFPFLRPRATTPTTSTPNLAAAVPSLSAQQIGNSNIPSKSYHRMNLRALYKRVSSEFRSAHDPAAASVAASLFEAPCGL
ncbi:unnamed protein product [Calypogeia fissa]